MTGTHIQSIIIVAVEHKAHKNNSFINSMVFNFTYLSAYNKIHKKKVVLAYYKLRLCVRGGLILIEIR